MKKLLLFGAIALSTATNAQVPNYVPTNGLVGWWPFNGNANDQSGNNLNGNVIGATLTSDRFGNVNSAYNFNVANWSWGVGGDEIFIPYSPLMNMNLITVSVWFRRTTNGTMNQGMTVLNRFQFGYNNPNGQTWGMTLDQNNSFLMNTWVLQAAPNNSQLGISNVGPFVDINVWTNVVFTFDGSTLNQYINGLLTDSDALSGFSINTAGNSGISIGVSDQANGHWSPFGGQIDDIGIWNRALSACEVAQLYSGQLSTIAVYAGTDVQICSGQAVTLSGTGASTYTWDNGVSDGVPFTPTTTTTYTVTGTDAAGCAGTDQITITVNDLPTIDAGADQTVCSGSEVTLSGAGAVTYSWDNSVTNGTPFTTASTATYTVTGTDVNGCENTDQVTIIVNDLPTIDAGIDQTVCFGESLTLSANGAINYSWDNGVTDGTEFTPTSSQTYTVTGTDANGCENTDEVLVTVNPLPDVTGVVNQTVNLSAGNTAQFTVPSGSTSYQWQTNLGVGFQNMSNAGQYSGTTTNVLTISNVTLSNFNQQFRCLVSEWNCSDTSDVAILTVIDDLSIEENGASTINIYPNPTTSFLTIEGEWIQNKDYTLVDIQGRIVLNGTFKSNKETIDLKTIARGQYMLRIEGKELKVVKE